MSNSSSLKLFSGTSHPSLAHQISCWLGIPLLAASIGRLPSREISVLNKESVGQADIYVLGAASSPACTTNSSLMELLVMIHSCSIALAGRITAVFPHFPYVQQDKKDKLRAPITAKLVANMIREAGAHHVIVCERQDLFKINPVHMSREKDNRDLAVLTIHICGCLYAKPTLVQYIKEHVNVGNSVIVSPVAAGAKRVLSIAAKPDLDFALFHKEQNKANKVSRMVLVGSVKGKTAILVDDMVGNHLYDI
ncbi:N-terminal domain of ribose phosphate pyrophosphokinase-domain-containing protein [Phakopsora pachyrhizi]|nr:N-terminal domain of ribose phosphate pyrophosphokinase-domain-containing protein [Phakopsora pachyrhizi]